MASSGNNHHGPSRNDAGARPPQASLDAMSPDRVRTPPNTLPISSAVPTSLRSASLVPSKSAQSAHTETSCPAKPPGNSNTQWQVSPIPTLIVHGLTRLRKAQPSPSSTLASKKRYGKRAQQSRDVLMQAPQRLLSGCSTIVSLKGLVRAVVRRAEREVQVSSSVRGARAGSTVGRSVRRWTGLGISLIACRCEVAWVGFEVGDGGLVALRCVQASLARAFVLSRGFCQ
jgi:hypothetical protein